MKEDYVATYEKQNPWVYAGIIIPASVVEVEQPQNTAE